MNTTRNNLIIPNKVELEKIKKLIAESGTDTVQVLADFDRTLTTAFVDGKSVPSAISILRDGNYLAAGYAEKAHALFDKYHAIEIDPSVSFEEKYSAMEEWWTRHSKLLIESGLNKSDLKKAAESGKIRLRDGFTEFMDTLRESNIPLVIMSSSGLGTDLISLFLEKEGKLYDNVYIISNTYEWDEDGNAVKVTEPIIHSLRKYETAIQDYPAFDVVKERKNVILIGDSLDDVGMVKGFEYENLIKIGFLNYKEEENLETYKKTFDIVLTNDTSMEHINKLLIDIIN